MIVPGLINAALNINIHVFVRKYKCIQCCWCFLLSLKKRIKKEKNLESERIFTTSRVERGSESVSGNCECEEESMLGSEDDVDCSYRCLCTNYPLMPFMTHESWPNRCFLRINIAFILSSLSLSLTLSLIFVTFTKLTSSFLMRLFWYIFIL